MGHWRISYSCIHMMLNLRQKKTISGRNNVREVSVSNSSRCKNSACSSAVTFGSASRKPALLATRPVFHKDHSFDSKEPVVSGGSTNNLLWNGTKDIRVKEVIYYITIWTKHLLFHWRKNCFTFYPYELVISDTQIWQVQPGWLSG